MAKIKTAAVEILNGNPVVVVGPRDGKCWTAFRIVDRPEAFVEGQQVSYRVLWEGGWEGDGADVQDSGGVWHRAHLEFYTTPGSPVEVAARLDLDPDDVALGQAGIRRGDK